MLVDACKVDLVKLKYMILNDLCTKKFGGFIWDVKVLYDLDNNIYKLWIKLVDNRKSLIKEVNEYICNSFGLKDKYTEHKVESFDMLIDLEYIINEENMPIIETLCRMRKG